MALSDPQTVTINAVASSMPRTSVTANSSTYKRADNLLEGFVSHEYKGGRERHLVRLTLYKDVVDPYSAKTTQQKVVVYLVVDQPISGFTDLEITHLHNALIGWTGSSSMIIRTMAGES